MKKDTFGINMKQYCRDHERMVTAAVDEKRVTPELIALHTERIHILQHERLVHLIVTVMVVFVELFVTFCSSLCSREFSSVKNIFSTTFSWRILFRGGTSCWMKCAESASDVRFASGRVPCD